MFLNPILIHIGTNNATLTPIYISLFPPNNEDLHFINTKNQQSTLEYKYEYEKV